MIDQCARCCCEVGVELDPVLEDGNHEPAHPGMKSTESFDAPSYKAQLCTHFASPAEGLLSLQVMVPVSYMARLSAQFRGSRVVPLQ